MACESVDCGSGENRETRETHTECCTRRQKCRFQIGAASSRPGLIATTPPTKTTLVQNPESTGHRHDRYRRTKTDENERGLLSSAQRRSCFMALRIVHAGGPSSARLACLCDGVRSLSLREHTPCASHDEIPSVPRRYAIADPTREDNDCADNCRVGLQLVSQRTSLISLFL